MKWETQNNKANSIMDVDLKLLTFLKRPMFFALKHCRKE